VWNSWSESTKEAEGDQLALTKLGLNEAKKPGKLLLPHGSILRYFAALRIFSEYLS
jgi:hypothetical protein